MSTLTSLEPLPHIKGLIFDLDGTLADTMPMHIDSWKLAGKEYGVDITSHMIHERAGTPTIEVVQQLNELYNWSIDPYVFRDKKNIIYREIKNDRGKIKPVHRVMDIAKLYHKRLPMAIGTGSIKTNASMALEDLGISHWFKGIITADDVVHPKPHPETFIKCAQMININPRDCMVYEDGPPGIEAALAAGMTVVNVDTYQVFHP